MKNISGGQNCNIHWRTVADDSTEFRIASGPVHPSGAMIIRTAPISLPHISCLGPFR